MTTSSNCSMTDSSKSQIYSLTVSYDGAPFSGFARQPSELTVQGELERALATIFKRPIETTCAGRTDAGVHALGQVISFELGEDEAAGKTSRSVERSVNALTHDLISVREFCQREQDFSARFSAVSREYRYFICTGTQPPIFTRGFSWHVPCALDEKAMVAAAASLIGEHDFKSFCLAVSAEGKTTMRNVSEIEFSHLDVMGEPLLVVKIVGNAFLHSMVRAIVGSLVLVGRGRRTPDWMADVLAAKDRRAAGENAPAHGLVFWHVNYS